MKYITRIHGTEGRSRNIIKANGTRDVWSIGKIHVWNNVFSNVRIGVGRGVISHVWDITSRGTYTSTELLEAYSIVSNI